MICVTWCRRDDSPFNLTAFLKNILLMTAVFCDTEFWSPLPGGTWYEARLPVLQVVPSERCGKLFFICAPKNSMHNVLIRTLIGAGTSCVG